MTTVEITSAGLLPAAVVEITQARLLASTEVGPPRVIITQAHLVPGDPPFEPSHARVVISQALLYPGTIGLPPGGGFLHYYDGSTFRPVPNPHIWNGTEFIPT